jgi:hypothetical protein
MFWLWLHAALAQDEQFGWLSPAGPGPYVWGTSDVPFDAQPRRKDFFLPDSQVIGQIPSEDLEIVAPAGEKRFLRYINGGLVDAWWVSTSALDPGPLVGYVKPTWVGTVLGPAEDGYRAYGVGSSWTLYDRTVFHWHDRMGKLDVIASRAIPPPQYGISRAEPLQHPSDTGSKTSLKGEFAKLAKSVRGELASCFDQTRMPVEATIELRLDKNGLPARIRVRADQPAFNLDYCIAGALMDLHGAPNFFGTLSLLRFQ